MLKTLRKRSKKCARARIRIVDFLKYELWVYTIVFVSLLLCAWLFNRWIEGLMFCIAHTVIRNAFDKQFHFNKTAYCLILTCAIIWFAIPITLPVEISLLSSIAVAFLVCFFGYLAQDRMDLLKATRKTISNLSREDVTQICNELGYNKDKRDLAIMFFVDKLKNKQVWEILCKTQRNIEWTTVNKYKYRIKRDFKRFLIHREQ